MIFEVLQIIKEEVNSYFEDDPVALDNIATIDSDSGDSSSGDIICSLVNIQEEATLKNIPNYKVTGNTVSYKNPKINLNLCIMFCASDSNYIESLKSISKVIEFFQGKRIFTQDNSNYDRDAIEMQGIKDFKFVIELFTPSFEELNYIWGTLGGKQYPSVLYKVRLLEIERELLQSQGTVITEVNANFNILTK